ncbi:MAG: protein-glutamate O-methyltransferase CheR [Pseudomonadota bacterium]
MSALKKSHEDVPGVCALPRTTQQRVIDTIYQQSGIHLGELTCQFVETRLKRRLRAVDMDDPGAYLDLVDRDPNERERLVNAFTTNETAFFRTAPLWRYLENNFLPAMAAQRRSGLVRFWSAACSTGEEAYSLAMLSELVFGALNPRPRAQVLATDICTDVLQQARRAEYDGRNINRLRMSRPDMLETYFSSEAGRYTVAPHIRKKVQFAKHNLMEDNGQRETYDLVMLRNVLIYFSQDDQIRIVSKIVSALRPGGVLTIGESESLGFFDSGLDYVQPFIYRKPEQ